MFGLPLYAVIVGVVCSVVLTLSCLFIIYRLCSRHCRNPDHKPKPIHKRTRNKRSIRVEDWIKASEETFPKIKPKKKHGYKPIHMSDVMSELSSTHRIQSQLSEENPAENFLSKNEPMTKQPAKPTSINIQPQVGAQPNGARRISKMLSFDESREEKIEERYKDLKVAQMELCVHYNNKGEIVMSLNKVDLVHSSVNISTAYVELRRHPDRKLSQPQMIYSKNMDSLIGKNNHKYVFKLPEAELSETIFTFYLWSTNKTSRVCQSGECNVQFNDQDYDFKKGFVYKGDFYVINRSPVPTDTTITLMLKYHQRSDLLSLVLEDVKNLPRDVGWRAAISEEARAHFLLPSPYVKVHLLRANGDKEKQKTSAVKGYDVTYKQSFVFDVPIQELKSVRLLVQVVYSSRMTGYTLGVLEFSADSTGREGEHWRRMEQGFSEVKGVFQTHVVPLEPDHKRPKMIRRKTSLSPYLT